MNQEIRDKYQSVLTYISDKKKTSSLRTIYNNLTKNGIEILVTGDYRVVLEAHHLYEWLELSIWYEPACFTSRGKIESIIIKKND
jgi:hypothetical protein